MSWEAVWTFCCNYPLVPISIALMIWFGIGLGVLMAIMPDGPKKKGDSDTGCLVACIWPVFVIAIFVHKLVKPLAEDVDGKKPDG
jgi:hypothetical protein